MKRPEDENSRRAQLLQPRPAIPHLSFMTPPTVQIGRPMYVPNDAGIPRPMTATVSADTPQSLSAPSTPATNAAPETRATRILFIEDHADTAAALVRVLQRAGYVAVAARTIAEALHSAEAEMNAAGIDIVVSDLGLPDGSGLDLMRELSKKYGLRGIALSGFGTESDREQSKAAGFIRHLIKPVSISVLRNTVEEVVRENQSTNNSSVPR